MPSLSDLHLLYITDKKASLWRLSYALLPVMIWLYLMFFLKTTPAILFAFFLSIFFYLLDGIADAGLKNFRYCKWYAGLGFAFMLLWSGKLIAKQMWRIRNPSVALTALQICLRRIVTSYLLQQILT
jgi:hypothetical protein